MPKNIILIDAGPGSGKTTTLTATHNYLLTGMIYGFAPTQEQYVIMASVRERIGKILASEAVFSCMTTAGRDNIIERVPSETRAFTFNGLGASLLIKTSHKHHKYDAKRGEKIIEATIGRKIEDIDWNTRKQYYTMLRYIKCLKEELLQPTEQNLTFIQNKYGIEAAPPEDTGEVLAVMQRMMVLDGSVEFIDQYWLAAQQVRNPIYKLGYVDECQDVSAVKLLLMMRCCENLVFCGDNWQSINAFAGADYRAFERIEALSQLKLSLKTCFRCPPNHVEYANTIRPARIVAHKTVEVPDKHIKIDDLGAYIKENLTNPAEHMLISRLNAILLRVGMQLTKQGVAVNILKSKDHDKNLDTLLSDYVRSTRAKTISQLCSMADADKKNAQGLPFQAASFQIDRANCILELAEGCKTIEQLLSKLAMLTADSPGAIKATTIHKAKGLEAKFIYILYPDVKLKPTNQDQMEQEINLEFVSETRSLHQKIYVHPH